MTVKGIILSISPSPLRKLIGRIEASPLGYRLAKGAFWTLAGATISRVMALLSSVIVARYLGREGFGQLGVIQNTVGMFGTFAGFGLGMTATKHVAEFRKAAPARAGRIIALSRHVAMVTGALMAVTLFALAPWLAARTLAAPELAGALRISAAMLVLSALTGAQAGALAGLEAFKSIAKITLATGILSLPVMVIGVYYGGLEGATWGLVACSAANWLLNYLALRRETRSAGIVFTATPSRADWRVLWSFSLPAALAGVLVGPTNWVCNAILVNQRGGYGEMGLFNAASQWRTAVLFLPGALSTIVLPILSNLRGSHDSRRYARVLRANILANAGLAFAAALAIAPLGGPIMSAYGRGFSAGAIVLAVLVSSAVLCAINSVIGQAIVSTGQVWWGFLFNLLWAVSTIAFAALWVPAQGALGLALSVLAAYALHCSWQGLYMIVILRRTKDRAQ